MSWTQSIQIPYWLLGDPAATNLLQIIHYWLSAQANVCFKAGTGAVLVRHLVVKLTTFQSP